MPRNPVMLSNDEAFREGLERAAWKRRMAMKYFAEVNYKVEKITEYDHRDLYSLATLLIDITPVANASEDEKIAYFKNEIKQLENDFVLTKNPQTRLPYLRRLYEEIALDCEIDWDSPEQIDHLCASVLAQQALGTMVEKLPSAVLSIFPTIEDAKRLDLINMKNYNNLGKFQAVVVGRDPNLLKNTLGTGGFPDTRENWLAFYSTDPIIKAMEENSNVIMFDPTVFEPLKKHFLGDSFDYVTRVQNDPSDPNDISIEHFTEDDAAVILATQLAEVSGKTVNETRLTRVFSGGAENERRALVLIDGKSLKDIYEEQLNIRKNTDTRTPERDANRAMAKILRDSLTDGHSVVSVVRPNLAADGKVSFTHQEVKVDLDKLNKIERNEKHNAFRRALDYLRIYKIKPKYASNAARDERQSEYKNTAEYKNMLASVEKKFIDTFNKNSLKTREKENAKILENAQKGKKKEVERDRFLQAYPEISAVGENNEQEINQEINNSYNPDRYNIIVDEILEEYKDVPVEPMKEDTHEKSLEKDPASI